MVASLVLHIVTHVIPITNSDVPQSWGHFIRQFNALISSFLAQFETITRQ